MRLVNRKPGGNKKPKTDLEKTIPRSEHTGTAGIPTAKRRIEELEKRQRALEEQIKTVQLSSRNPYLETLIEQLKSVRSKKALNLVWLRSMQKHGRQ